MNFKIRLEVAEIRPQRTVLLNLQLVVLSRKLPTHVKTLPRVLIFDRRTLLKLATDSD